jgi:hypothetical protein
VRKDGVCLHDLIGGLLGKDINQVKQDLNGNIHVLRGSIANVSAELFSVQEERQVQDLHDVAVLKEVGGTGGRRTVGKQRPPHRERHFIKLLALIPTILPLGHIPSHHGHQSLTRSGLQMKLLIRKLRLGGGSVTVKQGSGQDKAQHQSIRPLQGIHISPLL